MGAYTEDLFLMLIITMITSIRLRMFFKHRERKSDHFSLVRKSVFALIMVLLINGVSSAAEIERRRPQDPSTPNTYYALPWYVHVEGIGNLWGGVAGVANILDSGTDIAGFTFQNSNFHIRAYALNDLFLLGNKESFASLTISGGQASIDLKDLETYDVGSNSSSEPHNVEGKLDTRGIQLQLRLFTDRVKLSAEAYRSTDYIRLADYGDRGQEGTYNRNRIKLELDLTDDRYDSRFGLRTIFIKSIHHPDGNIFGSNEGEEHFEIDSREISVFIPFYTSEQHNHTLALNYYLSTLTNQNSDLPVNRRDGNELGGPVRMRGYPNRRFVDANTLYYCAEYRWTIIDDFGLNDDFVLSNDNLEGLQFSLFKEWGQVSEHHDASLYRNMKTDVGFGIRAIMSSVVIRLDIGFSDEGTSKTFIITQPF